MSERALDVAELLAVVAVGVAFGMSFGFNYGVNNQVHYLLGSLQLLHPGLLGNDWLISHTTHYHRVFEYLGALLILLNRQGWGVGIGLTVVIAAGCFWLFWLIRGLVADRRQALPAYALLMALAFITNLRGPGMTYVVDGFLQPSTLASVALLAAAAFFVRGRWLAAGIAAALGGLLHVNFGVLFILSLATAHVVLGRVQFVRRLALQLGPLVLVMLGFLPMLLATAASPHAAEAQQIYFNIRAPHHFVLSSFEHEFVPVLAWQLIGIGLALSATKRGVLPMQRMAALLAGFSVVVWAGAGLSAVGVAQATQLFPWRIAPHLMLLSQAVACVSAVRLICEPAIGRRFSGADLTLLAAGLGTLFLYHGIRRQPALLSVLAIVLAAVGAVQLVRWASEVWVSWRGKDSLRVLERVRFVWSQAAVWAVLLGAAALLYDAAEGPLRAVDVHSTLIRGLDRNELDLYRWMKASTPLDTVFLTPPSIETMRYHGQRPIVVDWKSNPAVPDELLEWARRLEDVTGRRLTGFRDLGGYDMLDASRLAGLRAKYKLDYVVVRRGAERRLSPYPVAYVNRAFAVVDVRDSSAVTQAHAQDVR